MFELVKIKSEIIGGEEEQCVDARELWRALKSKSRFRDWIQKNMLSAQLSEGQDLAVSRNNSRNSQAGRPTKEYSLTLDAAKHCAMLEHTAKGKEIRQYFIDVEKLVRKVYQESVNVPPINKLLPEEIAKRMLINDIEISNFFERPRHLAQQEAVKYVQERTGIDYTRMLTHAPAQDNIKQKDEMLEPTEIGKLLGGITAQKVNKLLRAAGYQIKINGMWVPIENGISWSIKHAWKNEYGSKTGYNLKWNVDHVVELLRRLL